MNEKRCVFERPEWQAHIDQVRVEDMASPKVNGPIALFIDLQDRIFCEVAKVPGFLFCGRRVRLAPEPWKAVQSLAAEARRCSQALYTLAAQLRLAAAVQGYQSRLQGDSGKNGEKPFIGPIPWTFPHEFANSVLHGSEICLFILRLLLDWLDSADVQDACRFSGERNNVDSSDPLPFRIVSKLARCQEQRLPLKKTRSEGIPSADKWLDQVAASMGLEAFDIITYASGHPNQEANTGRQIPDRSVQ